MRCGYLQTCKSEPFEIITQLISKEIKERDAITEKEEVNNGRVLAYKTRLGNSVRDQSSYWS